MKPYLLKLALKTASETPGIKKYKLGAVLYDKRGNVKAAKGNQRKTHTDLAAYTEYPVLHAESHCCISHGLRNCRDLNMLVVRLNSSGHMTMARPCDVCSTILKQVGVRYVTYSDWEGNLVTDDLNPRYRD